TTVRSCPRGAGTASSANSPASVSSIICRRRRVRARRLLSFSSVLFRGIAVVAEKSSKMVLFWPFVERHWRQPLHLLIKEAYVSRCEVEVYRPHPAAVLRSTGHHFLNFRTRPEADIVRVRSCRDSATSF